MSSVEIPLDYGVGTSRKSRRTRVLREELFKKQEGKCHWCGGAMELNYFKLSAGVGRVKVNPGFATFEHLLPRANGGLRTIENVVLAHGACNHHRHKKKFPHDPVYGPNGVLPISVREKPKKHSEASPSDWSEGPIE